MVNKIEKGCLVKAKISLSDVSTYSTSATLPEGWSWKKIFLTTNEILSEVITFTEVDNQKIRYFELDETLRVKVIIYFFY